jgi:16S rRNA (guanine527-N7)-methyltransferase
VEKLIILAAKLGVALTEEQAVIFEAFYRILIDWNRKINLTAITGERDVRDKHFLDSLSAALAFNFSDDHGSLNVIDIGTGAGFPGLPLKIAYPHIHLTLLEATAKKTQFLEYIIKKFGLKDVQIITGRAEDVAHQPQHREKYRVALSRAVASLPVLAEIALPFCIPGGLFIAYKKGDILDELQQSGRAVDIMGGRLKEIVIVSPELFDDERRLVVIEKIAPSPEEYPRRPGMPEKRPLLS